LAAQYGELPGIRALGYPTSWAHQLAELVAIEQEIRNV